MKQIQLTYHEENGYLYPDLTLPEQTHHPIGKYGNLYLAFIKAHRKGTYTTLLTTGKLNEHLYLVDAEAKETVRRLTAEFAKARGIDKGTALCRGLFNCPIRFRSLSTLR